MYLLLLALLVLATLALTVVGVILCIPALYSPEDTRAWRGENHPTAHRDVLAEELLRMGRG